MPRKVLNNNLSAFQPLITPRGVRSRHESTDEVEGLVLESRAAICDILHGRDMHRLMVVVGPCSIHDRSAVLDYAMRLKAVAEETSEHLLIIMRTYFEKPRTTIGWKGLINDPHLDGSCDIPVGLELARSILLDINSLGIPCANEFLDPIAPQYMADLISWAAIGARTTESQTHREMASGISMPVGFKNGTDGGLTVAVNAMISASHPHSFVGITEDGISAVVKTTGNPDRHVVLRGGGGRPNYSPQDIAMATEKLAGQGIARPIMVDCSHGNSNKDHTRQGTVCRAVLEQYRAGERAIMGVMLESFIGSGNQKWKTGGSLDYGVSITDACIDWEETRELLLETAESVAASSP